jgi:ribosomal protein L33
MVGGFAQKGPACYSFATMAQQNLVKLVNKESGETYWTSKNKKKLAAIKLEFKKYSKKLRKVITFKESKK